ncbi:MAG: hypothetical protein RJB13_1390 [Pseudomonadota bacterium]
MYSLKNASCAVIKTASRLCALHHCSSCSCFFARSICVLCKVVWLFLSLSELLMSAVLTESAIESLDAPLEYIYFEAALHFIFCGGSVSMFSARKIALYAAVVAPVHAFAEGEMADQALQKAVVPYGLIQAYSNLVDTEAPGTPEFQLANVRFGLKVSEGITRARLETQILGNVGPSIAASNGLNSLLIRRADLGVELPSKTSIMLGRTRMGGADAWGMDATITVDQFSAIDGASITQSYELGERDSLTVAAAVGNSMGFPGGRDSRVFGNTLKTDRGVILGSRLSYQGLVATAYFGMEKNQVQQEPAAAEGAVDADGKPVLDKDGKTILIKTEKKTTARDVSHFEASLGYNQDSYAFGGWYQQIDRAKLNVVTSTKDGKFTTAAADGANGATASDKRTNTTVGLGFNGDSRIFDVANMLQKDDMLTYGFSVSQTSERDNSKADSDEKKNDVTQVVVGAGYAAGGFFLELGYDYKKSENKSFSSKNAQSDKTSSGRAYIVGLYSF